MWELIERLIRLAERLPIKRQAGFIWSDGSIGWFDKEGEENEEEHSEVLKTKFPDKINDPYLDFSFTGQSSIQLRVGHQLQPYETRIINQLIKEYDLEFMVVDVWEKDRGGGFKWLEFHPIPPSWAATVNTTQKSLSTKS